MSFKIINVNGHCEIYNERGEFIFSADNETEAEKDIEALLCA